MGCQLRDPFSQTKVQLWIRRVEGWNCNLGCIKDYIGPYLFFNVEPFTCHNDKEGAEVTSDSSFTRWFTFVVTDETFVILEKKGLPQHLAAMDSLDTPVTLQSLLMDMEDLGEARGKRINLFYVYDDVT